MRLFRIYLAIEVWGSAAPGSSSRSFSLFIFMCYCSIFTWTKTMKNQISATSSLARHRKIRIATHATASLAVDLNHSRLRVESRPFHRQRGHGRHTTNRR